MTKRYLIFAFLAFLIPKASIADVTEKIELIEKILPIPYYDQGDTKWCVPTSMAMIFNYYYGTVKNIHSWDIAEEWDLDRDEGLTWLEQDNKIIEFFSNHGLTAEKISNADDFNVIKSQIDIYKPVMLLMFGLQHAVVVVGYSIEDDLKKVYINDPSDGLMKEFDQSLVGDSPYIAVEIDWDDVAEYTGGLSYAIAVGSPVDPIPTYPSRGTIDIDMISQDGFYVTYENMPIALVYSWAYGLDIGIGWDFEELFHPLFLNENDLFIFNKYVTNHWGVEQSYKLNVEFSSQGLQSTNYTTDLFNVELHNRKSCKDEVMDLVPLQNYLSESGEYTITLTLWSSELTEKYDEIEFPPIEYKVNAEFYDNSPWPMLQHDAQHTGKSPYFGPQTAEVNWVCDIVTGAANLPSSSQAVVRPDGVICVIVSDISSASIYAINPDGTVRWQLPNLGGRPGTPAIGSDGTIYFQTSNGVVYAIDPEGTEKWRFYCEDGSNRGITIGPNGTIYVPSYPGLYALNLAGTQKWLYEEEYTWWGSGSPTTQKKNFLEPAVGPDGTIYVVFPGVVGLVDCVLGSITALNTDGTFRFTKCPGGYNIGVPSVGVDGTIYVAGTFLYAYDPSDGEMIWKSSIKGNEGAYYYQASTPAITSDGNIIAGVTSYSLSDYYALRAYSSEGEILWTFRESEEESAYPLPNPIADQGGIVFIPWTVSQGAGDELTRLYWIRDTDGTERQTLDINALFANLCPLAIASGRLYIPFQTTTCPCDLKLYAIGPDIQEVQSVNGTGTYFFNESGEGGDGHGINMSFSNLAGSGYVSVEQRNRIPDNSPTNHFIPCIWDLSKDPTITGFTAEVLFFYTDSDVLGFNESYLNVYRYNEPNWIQLSGTVNPDLNCIAITLNDFSRFGIFESSVYVGVIVFLEGPYSGGSMSTSLTGSIPITSPYSDGRTVDPVPAGVTDWVFLELRSEATGSAVSSRSFFLKSNGNIVDDDGTTTDLEMTGVSDGDYFIVVKHRNHLAVMSAAAQSLNSSSATLYDFTTGTDKYYGSDAAFLETGVYGMYTGDANGNGQVQNDDKNDFWKNNVGKGTQVPTGVAAVAKTWSNRKGERSRKGLR